MAGAVEMTWEPIETAPFDTPILLWVDGWMRKPPTPARVKRLNVGFKITIRTNGGAYSTSVARAH